MQLTEKDIARFWSKVDRRGPDECWPWLRSCNANGYGTFNVIGRPQLAHRVAFVLAIASIPDGMHILHRCDNPPCCNPAHLFLGNHIQNMLDRQQKGRTASGARSGRRTRPEAFAVAQNFKLSEAAVHEIRINPKRLSQRSLAFLFHVKQATIWRAQRGISWSHLKEKARGATCHCQAAG